MPDAHEMVSNVAVNQLNINGRGAELAVARTCEHASALGIPVSVAVVDASGDLVRFARMDGALPVSGALAIDKAWTAAACRSATEDWTRITQPGGEEWGFNTALGGRIVVQAGGVPIVLSGEIIGAVGVSGGSLTQDAACAREGVTAIDESQLS